MCSLFWHKFFISFDYKRVVFLWRFAIFIETIYYWDIWSWRNREKWKQTGIRFTINWLLIWILSFNKWLTITCIWKGSIDNSSWNSIKQYSRRKNGMHYYFKIRLNIQMNKRIFAFYSTNCFNEKKVQPVSRGKWIILCDTWLDIVLITKMFQKHRRY